MSFEKVEAALIGMAQQFTPPGSSTKATAHQWLHALAYDFDLYAANRGIHKKQIREVLSEIGVSSTNTAIQRMLKSNFPLSPKPSRKFKFIDLFAGIGGMRLGFQSAGGHCVFSSEFEKNAQTTYFQNHGEFPFGDITQIPPDEIPDHDVLIAGFPCQPFSHAGLKLGIDDTRGTLFHDIAKILDDKRPRVAVLENVKGLISHDKGYTLQVILKTLSKIGYKCNIPFEIINSGSPADIQNFAKKMILKSCDFGVPQNRQRIYIVLWLDDSIEYFDYPNKLSSATRVGDILESKPDPKFTISDKLWSGHQNRKANNAANGKGFGFGLVNEESPYTNTISARYYKDGSEILIAQKGKNPRKLTPREAARLQGFPDLFSHSESNVQAWKQFGNSVTVPVVAAVANRITKFLLK